VDSDFVVLADELAAGAGRSLFPGLGHPDPLADLVVPLQKSTEPHSDPKFVIASCGLPAAFPRSLPTPPLSRGREGGGTQRAFVIPGS
jgi:hypothetical protein